MWHFTFLLNNMLTSLVQVLYDAKPPLAHPKNTIIDSSNYITVQQAFFHSRVIVLHHLSSQCPAHLLHCVTATTTNDLKNKKQKTFTTVSFFLWYIS